MKSLKVCFLGQASENIAFREFARSDVFPLYESTRNTNFNKFLLWSAPDNVNNLMPMVDELINQNKNTEIVFLSIVERNTGKWIGVSKFIYYQDGIEASYWTHPDYHGNPIILEAFHSSLDIALHNQAGVTVYGRVIHGNEKAQKLVTKTGFKKIKDVYDVHKDGKKVTLSLYILPRNDWLKKMLINY